MSNSRNCLYSICPLLSKELTRTNYGNWKRDLTESNISSYKSRLLDKEKLSSLYKNDEYNNNNLNYIHTIYNHNNSNNNNNNKRILKKYNIKLPNITYKRNNNNLYSPEYNIRNPCFKSLPSACNIVNLNRQLVLNISRIEREILLYKYSYNISLWEERGKIKKRMPKIIISSLKSEFDKSDDESEDEKKEEKKEKKENKINQENLIIYSKEEDKKEDKKKDKKNNKKKENEALNSSPEKNRNSINIIQRITNKNNIIIHKSELTPSLPPKSRTFFTLTCTSPSHFLLFGGLSAKPSNEIWKFSDGKWTQLKIKSEEEPTPRYMHTAAYINNCLFIFGGETNKDLIKPKEDIIVYNSVLNRMFYPKIALKNNIKQRYGHISVQTNITFLVHGGFLCEGGGNAPLSSAFYFNIPLLSWKPLDVKGLPLPSRAFHAAALVTNFPLSIRQNFDFYSRPKGENDHIKRIKNEGIYIFGGVDENKEITNDLFFIKTFTKPLLCLRLLLSGIPSQPRKNSKLIFLSFCALLAVVGGEGKNEEFLGEVSLINLESLSWIKVKNENFGSVNNEGVIRRTEHCAGEEKGKVYILGGRGEENYLKMSFEILSFSVE